VATDDNRRPLETRSAPWAKALARWLLRTRVSPNAISVASIGFAVLGSFALVRWPGYAAALVAVAVCVQLRLLCNMLDGMVAIEGGKQSPVGALYNEIPDRVADSLFIVALGYAAGAAWLGWLGALAAAVTAYIRVLGGTCGLPQDFRGPLAKPQRMFVMTLGCLLGAAELAVRGSDWALLMAAWVIAVGSLVTCMRRVLAIAAQLRAAAR
jgi:phosphatidylglycerophosphate synthase